MTNQIASFTEQVSQSTQEHLDANLHTDPNSNLSGEESQEEKEPEKPTPMQELAELVKEKAGAPTIYDLEMIKERYGNFQASSVTGDGEIFIWRTLKRSEHKQMIKSGATKEEETFQEYVIRKCLIWPQPEQTWIVQTDAGVLPTLFTQIMHYSGFVPDQAAIQLVNIL